MVVSESQSDGRYGPTRLRVQRRTPFSDRRNHVSDAERVKSVCWRGSPDPLSSALAQQAAGRRSRRKLQEVALDSRLFTSIRSKKQPSARVVEPPVQRPLSTRTERALGRGSCPSRTHRVVRTMLAGGEELHQQGGRLCAALALACGRCVFVCLARPPTTAQRSWRARCMRSIPSGRRLGTERTPARGTAR